MKTQLFLYCFCLCYFSCTKSERNDVWIGTNYYYKNTGNKANRLILDFEKRKLFDLNEFIYIDSLENIDSFMLNGFLHNFDKYQSSKNRIYSKNRNFNHSYVFRKLEKHKSKKQFGKIFNRQWTTQIIKENESFVIKKNFKISYPTISFLKEYFLADKLVYSEHQTYPLDTLTYNQESIIIIRENDGFVLAQVKQIDTSNLTLFYHNSFKGHEERYDLANEELDSYLSPNFGVCNPENTYQYFHDGLALQNKRRRKEIIDYFQTHYVAAIDKSLNGYIRIRFIVNCMGQTGHFSIQEMDENYNYKPFPVEITEQLFKLTYNLGGWLPKRIHNRDSVDYNIHLGFKLINGQIDEILP